MLSFIKNTNLRKTIEDSIEYMNVIFKEAQDNNKSKIYKEETYRVIILYVVAVIEAILLYVIKERKDQLISIDYKYPSEIHEKIKHIDYPKEKLVTAIQCKKIKNDKEIGINDLVNFMKKNNLMKSETAEEILMINTIRNTFHFTKCRDDIEVEIAKVERSFALLFKIIKGAPEAIKKKVEKQ